jgi:hypothetical protein
MAPSVAVPVAASGGVADDGARLALQQQIAQDELFARMLADQVRSAMASPPPPPRPPPTLGFATPHGPSPSCGHVGGA